MTNGLEGGRRGSSAGRLSATSGPLPGGARRLPLGLSLCTLLLCTGLSAGAAASVPSTVLVQGVLQAKGGGPVSDGTYDVVFAIYPAAQGGSAVWTETVKLKVSKGSFSHALGSTKPLGAAQLAGAQSWLGAKVGGDPEMPRQRIHAGAFALRAAVAEGLACTGCVSISALKADGDLDLGGHALKAKQLTATAVVAGTVTASAFIGDGSKLTGIKTPAGSCAKKGEVVKGIAADGSLVCVKAMDPSNLPPDGLDEISNGLLTNQFTDTIKGKPVPIPDNNPTGVGDTIDFPDIGIAQQLDVTVDITNSDISKVSVLLFDPNNAKYVLYDQGAQGTSIKGTWPSANKTLSGDLGAWVGKNPVGKWRLQVIDVGFKDNGMDGKVNAWSIQIKTLSTKKVQVKGSLIDAQGKPLGRVMTTSADALKPGGKLSLTTGAGTPGLLAQAWVWEAPKKRWVLANTSGLTNATCTSCGTGADGDYLPKANANLAGKTYNFKRFIIPKGVTITVTGTTALQVKATERIEIHGALILDGKQPPTVKPGQYGCIGNYGSAPGGAGGPGGSSGGKGKYGSTGTKGGGSGGGGGGNNSSYGSGGGGGGHGSAGSAGAAGASGVSPGAGGGGYPSIDAGTLKGGSGGGGGGFGGAYNSGGSGGGGGGGAVKLESALVVVSGKISANGGAGGTMTNNCDGGAGGGGSGGAIWIRGGSLTLNGASITALGGAGGVTVNSQSSDGGDGGKGGVGRVRIDSSTAFFAATQPTYTTGDATSLGSANNSFRLDQQPGGTVVLTNNSGVSQKVLLVATF